MNSHYWFVTSPHSKSLDRTFESIWFVQEVSLRAKVIKVSENIMGMNWITLQDGTGTAPNDKLIATSSELVTVGEVVTAKGLLQNDVDLGYGYHYAALLEEATFIK